jgi:hypothetical protein
MLVAGLILTGAGLILLVSLWLRGEQPPLKDAKRSSGIVLEVRTESQQLTIRYLAGKHTFTTLVPAPQAVNFYVGQQVVVDYSPANPQKPLKVQSITAASGKRFLQLLLAVFIILAGLVLIRIG